MHFYPCDVDLLCDLGQAYDLTADAVTAELVFKQEEAYEHLTDAIRLHNYPKDSFPPVAYKLKARVAYGLAKLDETKQTLKAAIQLNPEDMDVIALQATVA